MSIFGQEHDQRGHTKILKIFFLVIKSEYFFHACDCILKNRKECVYYHFLCLKRSALINVDGH